MESTLDTSNRIKLLDQSLISKIAAGEIIERPANVVKELIENSIDAGSKSISVDIKNGGIRLIQITDDGCGIDQNDVELAFMRHSTSKLQKLSNLYSISTLGFRGEALAAISEVSDLELTTRRENADSVFGTRINVKGGKTVNIDEIGCPNGTSIKVRDLFFNTIVRLKYLKSDKVEAGFIADIVQKTALLWPSIKFKFISDGKIKFQTSGTGTLAITVRELYDANYSENSVHVDYSEGKIKVAGVVSTPQLTRSNRNMQLISVNRRYVKSSLITTAVTDAYKTKIPSNQHPFFILNIDIPFDSVDVNVHPAKTEVKFDCERDIYRAIYWAVLSALDNYIIRKNSNHLKMELTPQNVVLHPNLDKTVSRVIDLPSPIIKHQISNNKIKDLICAEPLISEVPVELSQIAKSKSISLAELISPTDEPCLEIKLNELNISIDDQNKSNISMQPVFMHSQKANYNFIGAVFGGYLIFQKSNSELLVIDQHAAHERLIYEDLFKKYDNGNEQIASQIVNSEIVVLTYPEFAILEKNTDILNKLGFKIDNFGDNSVIVREIPLELVGQPVEAIVMELVQIIKNTNKTGNLVVLSLKEKILQQIACKSAVKTNKILTKLESEELLTKILQIPNIESCPHGRPFMFIIQKSEWDRKFGRK